MNIIEYFSTDNKEYWLSKMKESDWGAGQFLHELLKNQKLKEYVGRYMQTVNYTVKGGGFYE